MLPGPSIIILHAKGGGGGVLRNHLYYLNFRFASGSPAGLAPDEAEEGWFCGTEGEQSLEEGR